MIDKNGVEIKHRDIIKVNADWFSKKEEICAVKKNPERLWFYDPNCCLVCRNAFGAYGEIEELNSGEIEVIGNLDTTPELLPLKDLIKRK